MKFKSVCGLMQRLSEPNKSIELSISSIKGIGYVAAYTSEKKSKLTFEGKMESRKQISKAIKSWEFRDML